MAQNAISDNTFPKGYAQTHELTLAAEVAAIS